jgi:Cytidine and deoxycytidylate deaminase zinc-binding region
MGAKSGSDDSPVGQLAETPAFWTPEQRGEEASSWLLFAHKYAYLEQLRERFPGGMTRSFCVPEPMVIASTTSERVLMLLAAALMESFDIQCPVTSEPEYSTVDGFVLDADRRAIVANWVGTEGLWFVDVTDTRSAVAHAEVNALANLAFGDYPDHVLYTTVEPCLLCTAALRYTHVGTVVFAFEDPAWSVADKLTEIIPRFGLRPTKRVGPLDGPVRAFAELMYAGYSLRNPLPRPEFARLSLEEAFTLAQQAT